MSQSDVRRLLLGDPRIATRIAETMGRRLGELEQRLNDAVFKSVPERVAGTVATLAAGRSRLRGGQVRITHEQLTALAGTSRETTTKVLGDLADQGLITLGGAGSPCSTSTDCALSAARWTSTCTGNEEGCMTDSPRVKTFRAGTTR